MSTTHQHKTTIASVSLQQAVEVAARKFEATLASSTSPRAKRYAQSGLAALQKFRITSNQ